MWLMTCGRCHYGEATPITCGRGLGLPIDVRREALTPTGRRGSANVRVEVGCSVASEAKKKGMADAYFGTIPNDRIEFTAGRDIVLSPPQRGEPLNYFVYPYAEAEGLPVGPPRAEVRFRRMARHGAARGDEVV